VFEAFFRQSIELCRQAGLVVEGPVYVDSTLIRAGASVDSLMRRQDLVQPPFSIAEYLQRLDQEHEQPDEEPRGPDSKGPSSSGKPAPPNQRLVSRTDPDATLVNRPDFGRHLAYKAHLAVSGRGGQVITAAVATTGAAADEHLLAEVLWQHRRLSRLGIPEVVADAKYGTTGNFLYLGQLGISTVIPTTRFGNMRRDIWGRDRFVWLPEEDAYLCPAGEKLGRYTNVRGTSRVQYRAPRGSCAACAYRTQCTPSGRERTIHRSWAQAFVDANEARLASPLGKQRLIERQIYVEGSFGLAKELHGLRRTRFKGRNKVQIQVWLTAAAMNIKKAVRSMAKSHGSQAIPMLLSWLNSLFAYHARPDLPTFESLGNSPQPSCGPGLVTPTR
jgi:Transposase DDE domain